MTSPPLRTSELLPPSLPVEELFAARARERPHHFAMLAGNRRLTYRQLDRRANQLARQLQTLGVGPNVLVGLIAKRSPEFLIGMLATLRAGGGYLPLDPTLPQGRIAFLLKDARPRVLLAQRRWGWRLRSTSATVLDLDPQVVDLTADDDEAPSPRAAGHHAAYAVYPAGAHPSLQQVVVPRRALADFTTIARTRLGLAAEDWVLHTAHHHHRAEAIYPVLTSGATLVLREDGLISVAAVLAQCRKWGITALILPTAFGHEVARAALLQDQALPATVRRVIINGEAIRPEQLGAWYKLQLAHRGRRRAVDPPNNLPINL